MCDCAPFRTCLERYNYPNSELTKGDSNYIESDSDRNAGFDIVNHSYHLLIAIFPLVVNVTTENTHEVGRCPNIWFIVKLIHELWLRFHFWIRDWVSPIVDHYQHKCTDY